MNPNTHLKFRVCYTAQDGSKTIVWPKDRDSRYYHITLDGKLLENYGAGSIRDMWEEPFDVAAPPIIHPWTGLQDKDGLDIYEGDIVESTWIKYKRKTVVCFWFGEYRLVSLDAYKDSNGIIPKSWIGNCWSESITGCLTNCPRSVYKVIGNVFQNPELLEKSLDSTASNE